MSGGCRVLRATHIPSGHPVTSEATTKSSTHSMQQVAPTPPKAATDSAMSTDPTAGALRGRCVY